MQKRQVLINALMSVLQILVISVILFILYRFLFKTIGVEALGLWSLVLATTSVTQIANLGLSGSVVKFVAKYIAHGDSKSVSNVIQTAVLSIGLFVGIVLVICYPIAKWLLGLVVPSESLPAALAILPYTFWALWLMMVTSIFQAGLDGYQRIDSRSLLAMGGALLHLLLCFILAPEYGLMGLAYARVIQNFTILVSSWFILKRIHHFLPILFWKWDKGIFKEIIGYGLNFQVISIINLFSEPVTKAFLSKFGGLQMLGFYEMASKMVYQFRSLIVSANQVLVPAISELKEKDPEKIHTTYLISYQLLYYLALPLYSLIIICLPFISHIWIGRYEIIFVVFGTLLAFGWFLNTVNVPAYFVNMGTGELRWNLIGHLIIVSLNVIFGFLLGVFYDGYGVIVAQVLSLVLGSNVICLSYHIKHNIPLKELLPNASKVLTITCLLSTFSSLLINYKFNQLFNTFTMNAIIISVMSLIILVPFWLHPMRKRVTELITKELLAKGTVS